MQVPAGSRGALAGGVRGAAPPGFFLVFSRLKTGLKVCFYCDLCKVLSLKVSLVGSFLVYCEVLFPKTINNFQNFNHDMSVVRNLCLLVVIKLLFNWRTIALESLQKVICFLYTKSIFFFFGTYLSNLSLARSGVFIFSVEFENRTQLT